MNPGFNSKYMSSSDEFPLHIHNWLRIHKDGTCERFIGNDIVLPGTDPVTGVQSKDVVISLKTNVFVRLYIPKILVPNKKLPTLIYYHGGGFVTESAASSTYQPTLNLITKESNVIIVSVNYRLAPEYLIPIAYEDSWEAIKWVATHARGNGPESWLNDHADLENIFFVGDSAGANIAHNMAIRAGLNSDGVINLKGVIFLHPYFGGKDPIGAETGKNKQFKAFSDQLWMLANPLGVGLDDPLYNPAMDTHISVFGCSKILLCVGDNDKLKDRGLNYKNAIEKSGWNGRMEVFESKGEGHVFFLSNTTCENARVLRNRICTFINPIRSKA
uniref:Probable carboxylesterase 2 n=1 Tax=Tanacetum cinerariifolium TaxID=118510 RepID=A0A699H102_TANCI|nr:probable carboxylesterase 2 [Tanacetum cinerariifolium]